MMALQQLTINVQHIVKSFTQVDGVVRVVVATIAFGMGLDSPKVHKIIHWGAPDRPWRIMLA